MYHKKTMGRLIFGLIILFLGVGYLLDSLHILSFSSVVSEWWPTLIILYALIRLLRPSERNHTVSLIILIVGFLLLLWRFNYITLNLWSLIWPLLLILFGLALLQGERMFPLSIPKSESDAFAFFGGTIKRVDSSPYTGGTATAIFGAVKLDLRKATIEKEAQIHTTAIFGGIDILVPENCQVQVIGTPIFGAFEDKTEQVKNAKCTVIIKGNIVFGGISIKN